MATGITYETIAAPAEYERDGNRHCGRRFVADTPTATGVKLRLECTRRRGHQLPHIGHGVSFEAGAEKIYEVGRSAMRKPRLVKPGKSPENPS
jgi:hypothetical protein